MKKRFCQPLALALTLLILLAASGCGTDVTPEEETQAQPSAAAKQLLEPEETYAAAALDTQPEQISRFNWVGVGTDYLYRASGNILEYYDFGLQAWNALCSAPNCDHTGDSCGAWVGESTWMDCVTPYQDKVYYLRCDLQSVLTVNCFDPAAQTHTVVCRVDCGEKIPAGSPSTGYIRDGMFVFVETLIQLEEEVEPENVVVQADLSSGKVVCSAAYAQENYTLAGIYQDQLIGIYRSSPTESEEFDAAAAAAYEGGYYEYLNSLPVTLSICTMPLGEEGGVWTPVWTREDGGDLLYSYKTPCYGCYFLANLGQEVFAVDVRTGEERSLFTAQGDLVSQEAVIGSELFYMTLEDQREDGQWGTITKYVLDLTTGENYRLGESRGEGSPFTATNKYFVQESVQYIFKEDYYQGNWDRWISLS